MRTQTFSLIPLLIKLIIRPMILFVNNHVALYSCICIFSSKNRAFVDSRSPHERKTMKYIHLYGLSMVIFPILTFGCSITTPVNNLSNGDQNISDGDVFPSDEDTDGRFSEEVEDESLPCVSGDLTCLGEWTSNCVDGQWVRILNCALTGLTCHDGECDGEITPTDGDLDQTDTDIEINENENDLDGSCSCGPIPQTCCSDGCHASDETCDSENIYALSAQCFQGECRITSCLPGFRITEDGLSCESIPGDDDLYDLDVLADGDQESLDIDLDTDRIDIEADWYENIDEDNNDTEKDEEGEDSEFVCSIEPCCYEGNWISENSHCTSGSIHPSCTNELCSANHTCLPTRLDGNCLIEGICALHGEARPGNLCQKCDASVNEWINLDDNSSCDDGNKCNGINTCQSGSCSLNTAPVVCAPPDSCHVAGTCNTSTGICSNPAGNEGSACDDDGDNCNGMSTCISGICTQTYAPITCVASDSCHVAGTCNPFTGICSNPPGNDGTVCDDDGNKCNGSPAGSHLSDEKIPQTNAR